jgi:hypothetical protein
LLTPQPEPTESDSAGGSHQTFRSADKSFVTKRSPFRLFVRQRFSFLDVLIASITLLTPTMETNCLDPLLTFRDTVQKLKSELDEFSKNHATDKEAEYEKKILPYLCQLRKLNRLSKETDEIKNRKIDELNSKLLKLKEQCDNATFEGQCLNHEVVGAKNKLSPSKSRLDSQGDVEMRLESNGNDMSFFDIERVGQMDHQARLEVLENEEKRRKALQDKLAEVKTETTEIEIVCQASEAQLNRIKPYIKQLLDKVDLGDAARNEKKD